MYFKRRVLEIGRLMGQTIQRKNFRQHKVIVAINKSNNNQKQDGTGWRGRVNSKRWNPTSISWFMTSSSNDRTSSPFSKWISLCCLNGPSSKFYRLIHNLESIPPLTLARLCTLKSSFIEYTHGLPIINEDHNSWLCLQTTQSSLPYNHLLVLQASRQIWL